MELFPIEIRILSADLRALGALECSPRVIIDATALRPARYVQASACNRGSLRITYSVVRWYSMRIVRQSVVSLANAAACESLFVGSGRPFWLFSNVELSCQHI